MKFLNGTSTGTVIASGIVFILSLAGVTYAVRESQVQSDKTQTRLCEVANSTRKATYDMLVFGEKQNLKNYDLTPKQQKAVRDFYRHARTFVRPIKCDSIK